MSFWLTFGGIVGIFLIIIGILYFIACEEEEKMNPSTIETYFGNEIAFEMIFNKAKKNAQDLEDIELIDSTRYLYRAQGIKAPMTEEAYSRLIKLS